MKLWSRKTMNKLEVSITLPVERTGRNLLFTLNMVQRDSKIVTVNEGSLADVIHPHVGRQCSLVFSDRFLHLPVDVFNVGPFVSRDSNVINKNDTSRSEKLKPTKCAIILKQFLPYFRSKKSLSISIYCR